MGRTEIDLYGIDHVKVQFIPVLKIYTIPILGSSNFETLMKHIIFDDFFCAMVAHILSRIYVDHHTNIDAMVI